VYTTWFNIKNLVCLELFTLVWLRILFWWDMPRCHWVSGCYCLDRIWCHDLRMYWGPSRMWGQAED